MRQVNAGQLAALRVQLAADNNLFALRKAGIRRGRITGYLLCDNRFLRLRAGHDIVHSGALPRINNISPDIGDFPNPDGSIRTGLDVLYVGVAFLPFRNRGADIVGQTLRSLAVQGHAVDVITAFSVDIFLSARGILPLPRRILLTDKIDAFPVSAAPLDVVHVQAYVQILGHIDICGKLLGIVFLPAARQQSQQQAQGQQQRQSPFPKSIHDDPPHCMM